MKQLLPILPAQADEEEIDIRVRDKTAERAEKNSNKCTDPRERTKFKPGDRLTVQDPASKKRSTAAIIVEEKEHGNSYVLTTEATDKTFIRGTEIAKTSFSSKTLSREPSEGKQSESNNYTPPTTRSKAKFYLEAAQSTMPKGARYSRNKGKEVCRNMSNTQVRADEATTYHEENNYGLFSLSADTGTTNGSSLLLYITIGLAIIGMCLQYKTWKANRTTKRKLKGSKGSNSSTLHGRSGLSTWKYQFPYDH